MKRVPICLCAFALSLLLLLPATAFAATPTYDQAVDQLIAQNYPLDVNSYLCSLGTNPDLGFRWAGTTADNAAAGYIAQQMRAMGLKNVRLEPVPVDEGLDDDRAAGDRADQADRQAGDEYAAAARGHHHLARQLRTQGLIQTGRPAGQNFEAVALVAVKGHGAPKVRWVSSSESDPSGF